MNNQEDLLIEKGFKCQATSWEGNNLEKMIISYEDYTAGVFEKEINDDLWRVEFLGERMKISFIYSKKTAIYTQIIFDVRYYGTKLVGIDLIKLLRWIGI